MISENDSDAITGDAASNLTKTCDPALTTTIGKATPALGQSAALQNRNGNRSVTVVFELGPETRRALAEIGADIKRLADHFDPAPSDIIGTPYLANKLGCTPTWIAQMVRSGEIPKGCVVPGSGKGREGSGNSTAVASKSGWPAGEGP